MRWFREALSRKPLKRRLRWPERSPRHDLGVIAATNDAMTGMHPSKMLQKYGWADPGVAQGYINLAGVVFADEAEALEARLLGVTTGVSTDRGEPETTQGQRPLGIAPIESWLTNLTPS